MLVRAGTGKCVEPSTGDGAACSDGDDGGGRAETSNWGTVTGHGVGGDVDLWLVDASGGISMRSGSGRE